MLIPPHASLSPYVAGYLVKTTSGKQAPQLIDLLPIGHAVLSCAISIPVEDDDGEPAVQWQFTGQLTRHQATLLQACHSTAYVVFHPAGAFRLFGDQPVLQDKIIDVYKLVPAAETTDAYQQLLAAGKKSKQILKVLEQWLRDRLKLPMEIAAWEISVAACNMIIEDKGGRSVTEICERLFISKTKLEKVFLRVVGLSPKAYCRIIRFRHAYQEIVSDEHNDWQQLLEQYPHLNQAHFIREFKVYCGLTPSQLFQSKKATALTA